MDEKAARRRRWMAKLLAGALFAWLGFAVLPPVIRKNNVRMNAERLIRSGDYEKAAGEIAGLEKPVSYDMMFLQSYCRGYPLYLQGRIREAAEVFGGSFGRGSGYRDESWIDWQAVRELENEWKHLEQEKAEKRKAEQKEEEERQKAEQKALEEQKEKEYQEKVRGSGMPFLGMKEADIRRTRLGSYAGSPWKQNESYWYTDRRYRDPSRVGKREVSHYDFLKDGKLFLEVFCTDGEVDELARHEDGKIYYTYLYRVLTETYEKTYRTTWYPNGYGYKKKIPAYDSSGAGKKNGKEKPCGDYVSEEDFYEDYADEFEDLDDAADDYLEHYQ